MKPKDFVYKQIHAGCIALGLSEYAATEAANTGLVMFNRNQFTGKPSSLIKDRIAQAKKINKKAVK